MTSLRNYNDATNKNIIRPQKAKIGCEFDVWVTKDSPKYSGPLGQDNTASSLRG